jgi:hypothetical protein
MGLIILALVGAERLKELTGKKIAFPFEEALNLELLPFKMIIQVMLK